MPTGPFPFNRYPVGLLGLLDAKVQGKTPNELAQVTIPEIDITQFLLAQTAIIINDVTAAIGAVGRFFGTAATLTVPNDEIWYIHAMTSRPSGVLGAGTNYTFRNLHETTLSVGPSAVGPFYKGNQGVGATGAQPVASSELPFLMQPGDRLGVYVEGGLFGVAATFQLFAKLSPLKI
jgi:hypothetical protein